MAEAPATATTAPLHLADPDAFLGPDPKAKAAPAAPPAIDPDGFLDSGPASRFTPTESLTNTPPEYTGWDRPFSLLRNAAVHTAATLSGLAHLQFRLMTANPSELAGVPAIPNPIPTADEAQSWLGQHGALSREQLTPTPVESGLMAGAEGLATTAPLMAMGPPGWAAKAATLGQGFAGGVLGEVARQIEPGNEGAAAMLPMLAAGLPAAGVTAGGRAIEETLAARAAGAKASLLQSEAEAKAAAATAARRAYQDTQTAVKAGLADAKSALTGGVNALKAATAPVTDALASASASSAALRDATISAAEANRALWHNAADEAQARVASGLGPHETLADAGTAAQAHGNRWLDQQMPVQHAEAWAPVDSLVSPVAPVDLSAYTAGLEKLAGRAGALQPQASGLSRSAGKASGLLKLLPKSEEAARAEYEAALPGYQAAKEIDDSPIPDFVPPPKPTWADAKAYRSVLGDARGDPRISGDFSHDQLSELYARLTTDMRRAAANYPGGAEAFDAANAESHALFNFAEGPLTKLLGAPAGSAEAKLPGAAAKALLAAGKLDGGDLAALRARIPQAADALAAGALRDPAAAAWHQLHETAQAALVPDEAARSGLNALRPLREAADAHVAEVTEAAKAAHAEVLAGAKATKAELGKTAGRVAEAGKNALTATNAAGEAATETGRLAAQAAAREADDAKAALPQASPLISPSMYWMRQVAHHLGKTLGGGALGVLADAGIGHSIGAPMAGLIGGASALALPKISAALPYTARSVLRQPLPVASSVLGSLNALTAQPLSGPKRPEGK